MKQNNIFDFTNKLILPIKEGQKKVFTNGCFDILHPGHIDYLSRAKKLGDILIVGLNSDLSVKKLKGCGRPVNNQKDRAIMLSSLKSVDFVVIFYEEDPRELLENLKPDIHVKGGDYKVEDLVEAQTVFSYGGEVKIVPFLEGYSTTKVIEKIKQI
jgi:glycerol-3-phosphate cytidylyltransferase